MTETTTESYSFQTIINDGWTTYNKVKKFSYDTTIGNLSETEIKYIKLLGLIYMMMLLICFISSTYMDGKSALLKFKATTRDNHLSPDEYLNLEWIAVRDGCNLNWKNNLWEAMVLPVTFIKNIIPWVVIYFNP